MVKSNKRSRDSDYQATVLPGSSSGFISQDVLVPNVVQGSSIVNGKSPLVAADGVAVSAHSSDDNVAAVDFVHSGVESSSQASVSDDQIVGSPGFTIPL